MGAHLEFRRFRREGGRVTCAALLVATTLLLLGLEPAAAAGGQVRLVSHAAASPATSGNATSDDLRGPRTSADGAFVAFTSAATNLVPGQSDTNNEYDVFLYERSTGNVTLVSHLPGSASTTPASRSMTPNISADGAFVTFVSYADDLVTGQVDAGASADVFLFTRATGAVALVSHVPTNATTTPDGISDRPVITADGSFVAFESYAGNLVSGQVDAGMALDVFLYQRSNGSVTLVSHASGAALTAANGASDRPSISADGAFVAFESLATNLVASQIDANGDSDAYLFVRAGGAVALASHASSGAATTGNARSEVPTISADGAFVLFQSPATNLVAGQNDTNATMDVFVFARATGAVVLVSHTPAGATAAAGSSAHFLDEFDDRVKISGDGGAVVFASAAGNLVPGQTASGTYDVFLLDRLTGMVSLVSHTSTTATAAASGLHPSISANGARVAFESDGSNLVPGQVAAGTSNVYLYARSTGAITLGSHTPASAATTGNLPSSQPSISGNGAFVAFQSSATNLVAGQSDANGQPDIFQFQFQPAPRPPADFTGNGTSDVAVFRPSTSTWFVQDGSSSVWGTSGDAPVPADYDGDGKADVAVFRPSTGVWYRKLSAGGATSTSWGAVGDIPVPADYDFDGRADLAVFRPSSGVWYVQRSGGGATSTAWGVNGDVPVPGDYDGDGKADQAVYRPSTNVWYVQLSAGGGTSTTWGAGGDVPVPGDYDGDGRADLAVFRPSTGVWYLKQAGGGTTSTPWGQSGDIPVPGDYDGDGKTDQAVYRPMTNAVWYLLGTSSGAGSTHWGVGTDLPLPLPYAVGRAYFSPPFP